MAKDWTAFFTKGGTPETGLSALVNIWNVSTKALVVTDGAMEEIGGGWYKYNHSTYDPSVAYVCRYDANDGSIKDFERYKYAGNRDDMGLLALTLQLREGNIAYEYVIATSVNATRKVSVGALDNIIIKVKDDGDSDWSAPVDTKTLYLWYNDYGDLNPIYIKESD